jgi:hypothetical protein
VVAAMVTLTDAHALWVLGELEPSLAQHVAWEAQAEGHDGPAIRTLASYEWSTRGEVASLLQRMFAEAGMPDLSLVEAARHFAVHIARRIISGEVDPSDGAYQITRYAQLTEYGDPALSSFVAFDMYFEPDDQRAVAEDIVQAARALVALHEGRE